MGKSLLFITEKKSMVANALIQGLEDAAFKVYQARPDVTDMARQAGATEIWLLFLQGMGGDRMTTVLSYIREQIKENQIRFFVIGTPEELETVLKGFPVNELKATFPRPFHTDEVVDRISMEAMNVQKLADAKHILLVDDDPLMLQNFKEMLQGTYRVYTANSGMNALQLLVNTPVDLILLDYEMPVINGPQILEMIRSEEHTKDIPVMFLTSNSEREAIIKVMSLNPANYLLKTLPRSEIFAKIKEFFER